MEHNRGLDLLRLMAGMSVVLLHYNYAYAFHVIDSIPTANRMLLFLLESISLPAVNVFLLLSGFFSYNSEKRTLGKAFNLLLIVVVFNELYYLGIVALGSPKFEWSKILYYLAPNQYFIVLYCAVYLISPYVNKVIKQLDDKGVMRLLLILTVIICIEPWVVDEIELTTGLKFNGLSMISHWGGSSGHTLSFFLYMYILGASLNRIVFIHNNARLKWGGVFVMSTFFIYMSYLKLQSFIDFSYYNPFILLQSISLIYIFKDIKCPNIVSRLSKAALACYVIHFRLLHFLKIDYYVYQPVYVLFIHIVLSIVSIYVLSFIFMTIYDVIFKKPVDKLNTFKINYLFNEDERTQNN